MDFLELAHERYSCRNLSDKKVEKELIDKILEVAAAAPTAVNKQSFKMWLVESEEAKEKIKQVTNFTFGAETFIVLGCKEDGAWVRKFDGKNFAHVDAAIVGTHIMMEIADLGLGSTWVGHFDAPKLKELCPQMKEYELVAIFPIGYPEEDAMPSSRHTVRKTKEELTEII